MRLGQAGFAKCRGIEIIKVVYVSLIWKRLNGSSIAMFYPIASLSCAASLGLIIASVAASIMQSHIE